MEEPTLSVKKNGVNFSRVKLSVGEKKSVSPKKLVTFHWLNFLLSQVSQKTLFIPLKFFLETEN